MDLNLKGKSVIVTAASKGLGRATALEYAREGAHVLLASRDEKQLKETTKEVEQISGNANVKYVVCDVKDPADIKQMVQAAIDWNGTVDVLINNAGGPPAGTFEQFTDDDWQHAFELNLLSVIRSVREVLPYMKKQRSGKIVTIASSSIKQSLDNLLLSNVFRPGILGLAKSLSQELAPHNILINTVGPGMIKTDRIIAINKLKAKETGVALEEMLGQAEQTIPIGRLGEPEEFAKAVVFLGSNANTYITGQALIVDGGLVKAL